MEGYVKLYRKLLDDPLIWKDHDYLAVWIYLLLNATHTAIPAIFGGEKITLKPGQLITGRKAISREICVEESKIQRILKRLESEQQIEQQTSNKNRLISLVNWDLYQSSEPLFEQQLNNNCTTTEQQVNTNKNVRMKECKKDTKNIPSSGGDKIVVLDFFDSIWELYPVKRGKGSVSHTQKQKLFKIGFEEMERAVKRYCEEKRDTDKQFWKNGSTFFNSGYVDYLDSNYTPPDKLIRSTAKGNQFHNFHQRETDYDAMIFEDLKRTGKDDSNNGE